jgi:hypothetical protein
MALPVGYAASSPVKAKKSAALAERFLLIAGSESVAAGERGGGAQRPTFSPHKP